MDTWKSKFDKEISFLRFDGEFRNQNLLKLKEFIEEVEQDGFDRGYENARGEANWG